MREGSKQGSKQGKTNGSASDGKAFAMEGRSIGKTMPNLLEVHEKDGESRRPSTASTKKGRLGSKRSAASPSLTPRDTGSRPATGATDASDASIASMPVASAALLAATSALAQPCLAQGRPLMGLPRVDAVAALRRIAPFGHEEALEAVACRLRDTDHEVRREAAAAVAELAPGNQQQAVELCGWAMEELDWRARGAAAEALAASALPAGDEHAISVVTDLLETSGVLRFAGAATTGQVLVGQLQDLKGPMGVTLTDVGLVVVDTDNHRVLLCPSWQQDFQQSVCKLVAGTGSSGFEASELRTPYTALAQISDAGLGLIIADTHNHRVQFWAPGASEGITLVGGPGFGAPGYDGPGELEFPTGLAMDEVRGFLFVADTGHHRVVRYPIDLAAMSLGAGITVAGTSNVSGSAGSLLDNPTAIAYRNDRLYVADARNSRVMTWLVRPELVDAEVSARRLSSIDDFDDNETSDVNASTTSATQTSTTTRSTSTITTITVTTTTTYTGPRYMLEMDGFQGRPYGVVAAEDSIYVADADGCMVWKKLYTGEKSVVVGSACGGSLNQIFFPGGIGVEQTGAIVIADSRNNRVIRFGPEPLPLITKCTLGGFCEVTLRQGLPTRRSRLALVKRDVRSVCGGRCIVSGLGGGTWAPQQVLAKFQPGCLGRASEVSVPASEPPYLSVMTYKFGVAGYGETMRCSDL
ncbi:unnamed protein product [Effrenium voratum]|nr:unnamed protein product [Effrenium voratum]